eukprot:4431959-Prymnesium_polylepis.1
MHCRAAIFVVGSVCQTASHPEGHVWPAPTCKAAMLVMGMLACAYVSSSFAFHILYKRGLDYNYGSAHAFHAMPGSELFKCLTLETACSPYK